MGCSSSPVKHETLETGEVGRYQLFSTFMIDTKTGRSWKHMTIKNMGGAPIESYWTEEFVQAQPDPNAPKPVFDETQPFEKVTIHQE